MTNTKYTAGDLVQMEQISYHGNTEGIINHIFHDENDGLHGTMKANITWGDYRHKQAWYQITNTPLFMIQPTTKIRN